MQCLRQVPVETLTGGSLFVPLAGAAALALAFVAKWGSIVFSWIEPELLEGVFVEAV